MKIIVEGNVGITMPVRFTCKRCECVFEANYTEYHAEKQRGVSPGGYNIFDVVTKFVCNCPCCGAKVIKENEIDYDFGEVCEQ